MSALDTFAPVKAAGAGALLSGLNSKNSRSGAAAAIAGTTGAPTPIVEQRVRDDLLLGVKLIGDGISGL
jgi:hypothetical protein